MARPLDGKSVHAPIRTRRNSARAPPCRTFFAGNLYAERAIRTRIQIFLEQSRLSLVLMSLSRMGTERAGVARGNTELRKEKHESQAQGPRPGSLRRPGAGCLLGLGRHGW